MDSAQALMELGRQLEENISRLDDLYEDGRGQRVIRIMHSSVTAVRRIIERLPPSSEPRRDWGHDIKSALSNIDYGVQLLRLDVEPDHPSTAQTSVIDSIAQATALLFVLIEDTVNEIWTPASDTPTDKTAH